MWIALMCFVCDDTLLAVNFDNVSNNYLEVMRVKAHIRLMKYIDSDVD